jgi:hemoglobin-like flavoprotein
VQKFDFVNVFAVTLLAIGVSLFAWGWYLDPPESFRQLMLIHFGDWTPGFVIDGVLLLVLNQVIRSNERRRVISQAASSSNEFALDAVRRCREEGWLQSGIMGGRSFAKARLSTADLSDAKFPRADFSFTDLTGTDLTYADLKGANLKGANLSHADLRWADLTGACLQWADLRNAQLDGANLKGIAADFASIDVHQVETPEFQGALIGGFISPHQIELVKSSFELVLLAGDSTIVRFYERLFDVAPHLRELFTTDVERQARKFLQSLKLIVNSLSSIEHAAPVLDRLGARHRGYGVLPEYYDVVGGVLVETLQEILAEEFTDDVKVAWVAAFQLISTIMRSSNE